MQPNEARAQLKCGACRLSFCVDLSGVAPGEVVPIDCPRCGHRASDRAVQALLTIMRSAYQQIANQKTKENT